MRAITTHLLRYLSIHTRWMFDRSISYMHRSEVKLLRNEIHIIAKFNFLRTAITRYFM